MTPGRGFLLPVVKPAGPTSRQVVDRAGRALGRRDLGHAGTLDPFASGLLLLVAGKAAKLIPWIHEWDKEYSALVRLGEATDTLDRTGAVTARAPLPAGLAAGIPAAVSSLAGAIEQAPPMHSAVKRAGVRLYELARRGATVERTLRLRTVHRIEVTGIDLPRVGMRVVCSTGTYVRSLAEELGRRLGVPAHLEELERTRIGPFRAEGAVTESELAGLDEAGLLRRAVPLEEILGDWPCWRVDPAGAVDVAHGRIPALPPGAEPASGGEAGRPAAAAPPTRLRILGPDGGLLALVECPGSARPPRFLRVFPPGGGAA